MDEKLSSFLLGKFKHGAFGILLQFLGETYKDLLEEFKKKIHVQTYASCASLLTDARCIPDHG
jgi:hypothetical protein